MPEPDMVLHVIYSPLLLLVDRMCHRNVLIPYIHMNYVLTDRNFQWAVKNAIEKRYCACVSILTQIKHIINAIAAVRIPGGCVIAGGFALWLVQLVKYGVLCDWAGDDVDIFFRKQPTSDRETSFVLDLGAKLKTISSHLYKSVLRFDPYLNCGRYTVVVRMDRLNRLTLVVTA